MAAASRFPHLALPFAIVGAAGGWLSGGFLANPLVGRVHSDPRPVASLVAAGFVALAGTLLTRWCIGKNPSFESDSLDPAARPPSDRLIMHASAVLGAGALTGAVVSIVCDVHPGPTAGVLFGALCALAFLPVCLVVLSAARRAQRARLGSLVSARDRRAVWGILAMTLSVATLPALLDWPAARAGEGPFPVFVIGLLAAAALGTLALLVADVAGYRRAKKILAPGLVAREAGDLGTSESEAPRVDLGLGNDLAARVAAAPSAYRGMERTVALVKGDPQQALSAFRRAIARGVFGLAVVGLMAGAHSAARGEPARFAFDEQRCDDFEFAACSRLADALRDRNPSRARRLYGKACSLANPKSCVEAGMLYLNAPPFETSEVLVTGVPDRSFTHPLAVEFFRRACSYGDMQGCRAVALADSF